MKLKSNVSTRMFGLRPVTDGSNFGHQRVLVQKRPSTASVKIMTLLSGPC